MKRLFYISFISILFGLFAQPIFAQVEPKSSGSVVIGASENVSVGIDGYPNSLWTVDTFNSAGCDDLCFPIATSSDYTIISATFILSSSGDDPWIKCTDHGANIWLATTDVFQNVSYSSGSLSYDFPIHCNGNLEINNASDGMFALQYVPYDTRKMKTDISTSTVPYGDWIFVNVLILFCVAFIPVGTLFSLIPRKR